MAELFLHNQKVRSIFQLLGEHENDITYSVGWALAQSPAFLNKFLQHTLGLGVDPESVVIRLQQHEKEAGITDIEIESPGRFLLIVEAKRGWNLPSSKQLKTYARRRSLMATDGAMKRIVPMSECSREYAFHALGFQKIEGIDIQPTSWKEMATLAAKAQRGSSHAEKRLLRELLTYLRGLMTMQKHRFELGLRGFAGKRHTRRLGYLMDRHHQEEVEILPPGWRRLAQRAPELRRIPLCGQTAITTQRREFGGLHEPTR